MRLFAFTREEGSDERNPWAVLLQRGRLYVLEGALVICALFLTAWPVLQGEPNGGILGACPLIALAVSAIGGMLMIDLQWRHIVRSPLFLEAAITPQSTGEVMAAVGWQCRRWLIFSAVLIGAALTFALAGSALRLPAGSIGMVLGLAPLHLAAWLFGLSVVNLWMATIMSLKVVSARRDMGANLGCATGCGCSVIVIGPVLFDAAAQLAQGLPLPASLRVAFQGEIPAAATPSLAGQVGPPLALALLVGPAAVAMWHLANLRWRESAGFPLRDLQIQAQHRQKTWGRWLGR